MFNYLVGMLSIALLWYVNNYFLLLLAPCVTSVQTYRLQGKARTDLEITIAVAHSILKLLLIDVINFTCIKINPNVTG